MKGQTLIDLRAHDAKERGNKPEPDAIPYVPDLTLAAAIRVHTDALRPKERAAQLQSDRMAGMLRDRSHD